VEFTVHNQVLSAVFVLSLVLGAVMAKTSFCTMGAVSDWVNIGDTGRMRAWVFSMAVAVAGVAALEAAGVFNLSGVTFPPYRTGNFAWVRNLLGGFLFGVGMVLASGCGTKTLVRVGGGNFKSLTVLVIAAISVYAMTWTPFYEKLFLPWIAPTTVNLGQYGVANQEAGTLIGGMFGFGYSREFNLAIAALIALGMLAFVFRSADFRGSFDNILGGAVVGLAVVGGWYITAGPLGQAWTEYALMAQEMPSRAQAQSYTFMNPMGDTVRYLMEPTRLLLVNFGILALAGVVVGSFLYAVFSRSLRFEWFSSWQDFRSHAAGGLLIGIGGPLAGGCTVGQAITGVSTLAIGSILTFFAIVIGAAATMKFMYWRITREADLA